MLRHKMKYKFKIFGKPENNGIIEIEIDDNDTIYSIKKKIIKTLNLQIDPANIKLIKKNEEKVL